MLIPVHSWRSGAIPLDETPLRFDRILARAKVMKQVLQRLLLAAAGDSSVLLLGEPGTGKELVARSIHLRSRRRQGPFVALNCRAIPGDLFPSELFGHGQRAFLNADRGQAGRLAQAQGGTLLLDEIESLDLGAQADLYKALQGRQYRPVGSARSRPCDVRLIGGSSADLGALVREGRFQPSLLANLEAFSINLPPLRLRHGGVPFLAQEFLREVNQAYGLKVSGLSHSVLARLEAYPWPGNVRELKDVIQRAVQLAGKGRVEEEHLPARFLRQAPAPAVAMVSLAPGRRLADIESEYLRATLQHCQGNKSRAAALLGISRKNLYERLARLPRA
jgi:DNA-binding NtrC family response regulator